MNEERLPAPKFWFFHEWLDDLGRFWAQPRTYQFVQDARREHANAMTFRWQTDEMHTVSLSALYARDANGEVILQPQCRPIKEPTRTPAPKIAPEPKSALPF